MSTSRQAWFAELLYAGLETKVLSEEDILGHVTPTVLSAALPKDVMVRVFDAALATGTMSPKAIMQTVSPELMAEHCASTVWQCLTGAATRAGIIDANARAETNGSREFLRRAIAAGLVSQAITPKDLVKHVNAKVIGTAFPDALTAKLLDAAMQSGTMTPDLVVEVLGVDALAKHPPTNILWNCFEMMAADDAMPILAAGSTATELPAAVTTPAPKPVGSATKAALEILDDDMPAVTITADEPPKAAKPAAKPSAKA